MQIECKIIPLKQEVELLTLPQAGNEKRLSATKNQRVQKVARLAAAGAIGTALVVGMNPFSENESSSRDRGNSTSDTVKKQPESQPQQKEQGEIKAEQQQKSKAQQEKEAQQKTEPQQKTEVQQREEIQRKKIEEMQKAENAMIDALAQKADKESGTDRENLKKNIKLIVDSLQKRKIATPRVIAYAMATMETETAHTYKPVREAYYLDKAYGAKPGTYGEISAINNGYKGGKDYYGRGYIQITHNFNYKRFDRELEMDGKLASNPDLALQPNVAADILAAYFDVKGVAQKAEKDFVEARKPINGEDKAYKIAKDAKKYLDTIKNS